MIVVKPKRYSGGFASLSNKTLRDTNLTDGGFRLLLYLLTMSGEYKPSERGLAKHFDVSLRTIATRVGELKHKGYLRLEPFYYPDRPKELVWIVSEFPMKEIEDKAKPP